MPELARNSMNQQGGVEAEEKGRNVSEVNQLMQLATKADCQDSQAVVGGDR